MKREEMEPWDCFARVGVKRKGYGRILAEGMQLGGEVEDVMGGRSKVVSDWVKLPPLHNALIYVSSTVSIKLVRL